LSPESFPVAILQKPEVLSDSVARDVLGFVLMLAVPQMVATAAGRVVLGIERIPVGILFQIRVDRRFGAAAAVVVRVVAETDVAAATAAR